MTKLFDDYKKIIFPDAASQNALLAAMPSLGSFDEAYRVLFDAHETKDKDLQCILAPFLRALAIRHLKSQQTELSKEIKSGYTVFEGLDTHEAGDAPTFDAFLDEQSKAYIYATDLTATALAEALGVTFACTSVGADNMAGTNKPYVYYKPPTKNAPVVHLYNSQNMHFFIIEGNFASTVGDGNCLYNGFAQICSQHILCEQEEMKNSAVYIAQEKLYAQLKDIEPVSVDVLIQRVKDSILKHEKPDHQAAVFVAQKELNDCSDCANRFTELTRLINVVNKKADEFPLKYTSASRAAHILVRELNTALTAYQRGEMDLKEFQTKSLAAIGSATQVLEKHRDWSNILINLTAAVLGLGLPFIYNRCTTGHWFFKMPMKMESELDGIKTEINDLYKK